LPSYHLIEVANDWIEKIVKRKIKTLKVFKKRPFMNISAGNWQSHRDPIVFRRRIAPGLALSNITIHIRHISKMAS